MKSSSFYSIFIFLILFFFQLFPIKSRAGGIGVQFVHDLSWKKILEKAKTERKCIFIDCFATWCGPCKYMSEKIFSLKEVGDFMNQQFISVAVQMDATLDDGPDVKRWYEDAKRIEKVYSVNAYPTYLILSPDGEALHRITGASKDSEDFLGKIKDALDPEKQYYTLINHLQGTRRDSVVFRNALISSLNTSDHDHEQSFGEAYFNSISDPFLRDNLELICRCTHSSQSKTFKFLLDNQAKVNASLGRKNTVEGILVGVVISEEIDPLFKKRGTIEWKKVEQNLVESYPSIQNELLKAAQRQFKSNIEDELTEYLANSNVAKPNWKDIRNNLQMRVKEFDVDKVLADFQQHYYYTKKQWDEYETYAVRFVNKYGVLTVGVYDINNIAWALFRFSRNKKALREASKWCKELISSHPNSPVPAYIDTYANLLYKLGDRDNAIIWEDRAVKYAIQQNMNSSNIKIFDSNLAKMKSGEKTWDR